MNREDLPERWNARLRSYLNEKGTNDRDYLSASDFHANQCVRVLFGDGSTAFFLYAFYIADSTLNEAAVFTEHCGYHIFPFGETELQLLHATWTDSET